MVVLGLSQTADNHALRAALGGAGLSLDSLTLVEPDDGADTLGRGADSRLITSDGGTSVPGLSGGHGGGVGRHESLVDRLGDLGIPESELDNFVEALERGKTVAAYFAKPDNVDKVVAAFNGANLGNVRTF
jgi:hypothetical protein